MIDIANLKVGQKVHYRPKHYGSKKWDNGIVKNIRAGRHLAVWVVYHCDGKWDRFMDYTGALTDVQDLEMGWKQ
jgi:hypothetical protein